MDNSDDGIDLEGFDFVVHVLERDGEVAFGFTSRGIAAIVKNLTENLGTGEKFDYASIRRACNYTAGHLGLVNHGWWRGHEVVMFADYVD